MKLKLPLSPLLTPSSVVIRESFERTMKLYQIFRVRKMGDPGVEGAVQTQETSQVIVVAGAGLCRSAEVSSVSRIVFIHEINCHSGLHVSLRKVPEVKRRVLISRRSLLLSDFYSVLLLTGRVRRGYSLATKSWVVS